MRSIVPDIARILSFNIQRNIMPDMTQILSPSNANNNSSSSSLSAAAATAVNSYGRRRRRRHHNYFYQDLPLAIPPEEGYNLTSVVSTNYYYPPPPPDNHVVTPNRLHIVQTPLTPVRRNIYLSDEEARHRQTPASPTPTPSNSIVPSPSSPSLQPLSSLSLLPTLSSLPSLLPPSSSSSSSSLPIPSPLPSLSRYHQHQPHKDIQCIFCGCSIYGLNGFYHDPYNIPVNVDFMYKSEFFTRSCACLMREVLCRGCGNVVAYHIDVPCDKCIMKGDLRTRGTWLLKPENVRIVDLNNFQF